MLSYARDPRIGSMTHNETRDSDGAITSLIHRFGPFKDGNSCFMLNNSGGWMEGAPKHIPSWHSSRWHKNHPPTANSSEATAAYTPEVPGLRSMFWPRTLGLTVVGGFGVMRYYFWPGVVIAYFGFAALIWEVCVEPALLRPKIQFQIAALGLVLIFLVSFTIGVVGAQAPIVITSYAMLNANYSDGTDIGGIKWDSHLTDLRVVLVNPTDHDYTDVDIAVVPNAWTYRAAILDNSDCKLNSTGGNTATYTVTKGGGKKLIGHRIGDRFEAEDEMGDVFEELATDGGYRLICSKFPKNFALRIVLATVALNPKLTLFPPALKSGESGMSASEIAGSKSKFDVLNPRPAPSKVDITARYTRILKPFAFAMTIPVENGN
jgi:hypothetical protein